VRRFSIAVLGAAAVLLAVALNGTGTARVSDYDAELATLRGDSVRDLYLRASLTSDYAEFVRVGKAFDALPPSEDILFARATLAHKMHRLADAKSDLAALPESDRTRALTADIAFNEGRYAEALRLYESLPRTWDNLARLAYYKSKTGDVAGADRLYVEAEEQLTAKEMRSYAWLQLQRGLLRFDHGKHEEALHYYQRADRAYSGYWLIEEHIAEVLAEMGRKREATRIYRKVVEKTNKPEFVAALAKLTNDPSLMKEADRLFDEQYRLAPEAAIGHALEFLLEKPQVDPRLIPMAERNVALRPNAEAKLLLAQAYRKANRVGEAQVLEQEVRRTPWRAGS